MTTRESTHWFHPTLVYSGYIGLFHKYKPIDATGDRSFNIAMEKHRKLKNLALWAGLVPFIAIHASYLIAATQTHVPWCVPYWDSCTSISATGRHGIAYGWFKLTMIPAALILFMFWRALFSWQVSLEANQQRALMVIGCIGAICLAVYTVALGEAGDLFRRQRQIGATIYFTFTYLAQLLLVAWLFRHAPTSGQRNTWLYTMFATCAACLIIGIISLLIDAYTHWHDDVEDAIEWILALLIDLNFLFFYGYLRSIQRQDYALPTKT
jgi:hypothetical protein